MALKKDFTGKTPFEKPKEKKSEATDPSSNPITPVIKPKTPSSTPAPKEDVTYERDNTGKLVGAKFSDGRSFSGLDPRDIVRLAAGYKRSLLKTDIPQEVPPASKAVVPNNTLPPQPDILSELQQPTIAAPNELSQSISENVQDFNRVNDLTDPLQRLAAIPSSINKLTSFAGRLPGGKSVINSLASEDPNVRRYLQDYSNEDNFNNVVKNIELSDDKIKYAKSLASIPGYTDEAKRTYIRAQAEKRRALQQLKLISSRDQRAYTDKVRAEMIELQTYFDVLKLGDDIEMASNLQRAQLLGGVQ